MSCVNIGARTATVAGVAVGWANPYLPTSGLWDMTGSAYASGGSAGVHPGTKGHADIAQQVYGNMVNPVSLSTINRAYSGTIATSSMLRTGLTELWRMQEGVGNYSYNGGTDSANLLALANVAWSTMAGVSGATATFNGSSSYATNTSIANTGFASNATWSIRIHAYLTSLTSDRYLISDLDNTNYFGMGLDAGSPAARSAGTLQLTVYAGANQGALVVYTPAATMAVNTLTDIIVTYDGTGKSAGTKIYVNGAAVSTTAANDNLVINNTVSTAPLMIGALSSLNGTPGGAYVAGTLTHPAVWNRVLTAAEVASLYAAGPNGL